MGILILPGGALSGRPLVCFLGLFGAVFFPVFSWVFLPGLFCFVFVLFSPLPGFGGWRKYNVVNLVRVKKLACIAAAMAQAAQLTV